MPGDIQHQYAARFQAPLAADLFLRYIQHPGLTGQNQQTIMTFRKAQGAQAIPVQQGHGPATISCHDGCGTIPWLHQRRVILEKRADIAPHVVVLPPGLRNEHQQRMLQRPPGYHK